MTRRYILSKGAAADLKDIIRHTNEKWGEAQCLTYIDRTPPREIDLALKRMRGD